MHSSALPRPTPENHPVWFRFLLCCFTVICGFRFFLVEKFGAPIAWGDDLDGTAFRILAPLRDGTFTWPLLFKAHNGDHVIVATRLWEMLWFTINGEWDPKLVMIVKTPIYAAAMTIFLHLFTRGLERGRFLAAGILAALFAFPFNYQNLLWAFQSQFDFFFLAAALGWLALLNGRPVLALVCAAIAPFTLGAGPIVAVSYLPFFAAAVYHRSWSWRKAAVFSVIAIAIAAYGASLPTPDAMPRTGTWGDRIATLFKLYAWPYSNLLSAVERLPESANLIPRPLLNFPSAETSWMMALARQMDQHPILPVAMNLLTAMLFVAPMAVVAIMVARKRIPLRVARGPLNISVFAGCMLGATAIARTDQPTIAMRFLDHVMLAGLASITACFILSAFDRRWRPWLAGWGLILGFGYLATVGATMSQMINRRRPQVSLEILQRYYVANDHAVLRENDNFRQFIMGDDPTEFMGMLDEPSLRPVLPRAITAPGTGRGQAAIVASAVGRMGLLIALAGACGAGWIALRARRARVYPPSHLVAATPG